MNNLNKYLDGKLSYSMKIVLAVFFCFGFYTPISAQKVEGQIIDAHSQKPIPYVNVGVLGKNIGTVSDSMGNFQLVFTDALDTDTLRFSMVSYDAKDFSIHEIGVSKLPIIIQMNERVFELQEIVISSNSMTSSEVPVQIGLKRKYCYPIPLYRKVTSNIPFPQRGYRHEIGTRFTNSKTLTLDGVQLNIGGCTLDSVKIRLNIYTIKNEVIENILKEPIYITLSKKEILDFPIISLSKYNIKLDSDFLITIENHMHLPNGSLKILANFKSKGKKYPTYYRESSQSNWVTLRSKKSKGIGLSFIAFVR